MIRINTELYNIYNIYIGLITGFSLSPWVGDVDENHLCLLCSFSLCIESSEVISHACSCPQHSLGLDLTFNSDFICSEPHGPLNVDNIICMVSLLSFFPKLHFCLNRNIEILWNTKVEAVALKSHSNLPDVIPVN